MRDVPHTCPAADAFLATEKEDARRSLTRVFEDEGHVEMAADVISDHLDSLHFMYKRLREEMREALTEAESEIKDFEAQIKQKDREIERLEARLDDEKADSNSLVQQVRSLERIIEGLEAQG